MARDKREERLVSLVYLVCLVCLVEPDRPDRPDEPDQPSLVALFPPVSPVSLESDIGGCSRSLRELCGRGVCPSNAILLRQTICRHLRRSRPQEILDVFQRIRLRFLGACGLASASSSLRLATKDYSDRLLAGFIALSQGLHYNARHQSTGVTNE